VNKITQIVEKYSPTPRWRVDTLITMLTLSGTSASTQQAAVNIGSNGSNDVDAHTSVGRPCVLFIANATGLQGYAIHQLFRALSEDTSQQALLHVAIWCIGEYGDALIAPCHVPADNNSQTQSDAQSYSSISEDEVLALLDKCTKIHNSDSTTKCLVLNALMKLTIRFRQPASKAKMLQMVRFVFAVVSCCLTHALRCCFAQCLLIFNSSKRSRGALRLRLHVYTYVLFTLFSDWLDNCYDVSLLVT
jgi:AP-1 complex subunit gamma-1